MKRFSFIFILGIIISIAACTDLKEDIVDGIVPDTEGGNVDVQSLIDDLYLSLQNFQTQENVWCLQQHTTDEVMGPTRGTDWDDNGIWRVLHDHTLDAEHNFNRGSFNALNRGQYLATNILSFNPSASEAAVARFIRAFYIHHINDLWGQVPMRQPGEDVASTDPTVMSSKEASDFVISEVEAVMGDLPDSGPAYIATKDAARALLTKAYLNRGVYNDDDRIDPSFSVADMDKVIEYCDVLINSGQYSLSADYYDNFRPNNDAVSSELIFTSKNDGGIQSGNVRSRWFCTLHYNQDPGGWNGFCTIADFYDKFTDTNDQRWSAEPADLTPDHGLKAGFLIGQQNTGDGTPLEDRRGNPLAFTKDVSYFETGDNLEVTGVRVIKYIPDYANGDNVDNDYVFYRYADILLMKAEAIARGGAATGGDTPAGLVDNIRTTRGAAGGSDGSLESIYNERGFELYWEGHRRQDMIRFGKFLDAYTDKPVSPPTAVLCPIPAIELAANPNIQQNPGY